MGTRMSYGTFLCSCASETVVAWQRPDDRQMPKWDQECSIRQRRLCYIVYTSPCVRTPARSTSWSRFSVFFFPAETEDHEQEQLPPIQGNRIPKTLYQYSKQNRPRAHDNARFKRQANNPKIYACIRHNPAIVDNANM